LANTKSAIKAMRQSERRRVRNRAIRSRTRTFVKRARVAAENAPLAPDTEEAVRQAISALDRAVTKGVIHRNNAARRKARLMHRLQKMRSAEAGT
jgi:small subunit ribosomal protein S20